MVQFIGAWEMVGVTLIKRWELTALERYYEGYFAALGQEISIGPLSRTARPVAQAKSSITTSAKLRLPATHKTYHLYKFSR